MSRHLIHKYQVSDGRFLEYNAFSKAPADVAQILQDYGFKTIVLNCQASNHFVGKVYRRIKLYVDYARFFFSVKPRSVLFIQVPCLALSMRGGLFTLWLLKHTKGVHVISLIHDADEFRFGKKDANKGMCKVQPLVRMTDRLIVHNRQMESWYRAIGVNGAKIVSLGIFDYLTITPYLLYERKENNPSVIIAGTLDPKITGFVRFLKLYPNLKWELYGPGYNAEITAASNVQYNGCFPAEDLPAKLKGDFGLIWYGDSTKTCTGYLRDYLRIINPHKMSLYLASGIPIIVWSESAAAIFVKEHNVGICIDSLDELESVIKSLSREQYIVMRKNAKVVGDELRAGCYTRNAIRECFSGLNLEGGR